MHRLLFILLTIFTASLSAQPPIADGKIKFLGNVYSSPQLPDFLNYWNQVSPENAGKWGSVEGSRDAMNWGELDAAYHLAKDNGLPFKLHTLIWGNQQPSWIESLPTADQRAEIEEWFAAVAARYSDIDLIDVVNEPLHAPPSGTGHGNYIKALGGTGNTGWNWVIKAFQLARHYFPNAELIVNDYNIVNNTSSTAQYLQLVNLLKEQDLIDGIGLQCHAFSLGASSGTITTNLNTLATAGLPIYATELDIDGPTDQIQLNDYQRIFPLLWEHPMVKGITLWGFRPGMWRTDQGATLINDAGGDKPAMTWLKSYVAETEDVYASEIDVEVLSDTPGEISLGVSVLPSDASLKAVTWSVSNPDIARVSSTGVVSGVGAGEVVVTATAQDGSGTKGSIELTIAAEDIVTGLDPESSDHILVYPNPVTKRKLYLEGVESVERIRILDATGRSVFDTLNNGEPSVVIEMNAGRGVFALQLFGMGRMEVRRILVR